MTTFMPAPRPPLAACQRCNAKWKEGDPEWAWMERTTLCPICYAAWEMARLRIINYEEQELAKFWSKRP
jgi:hypothetical protein